MCYWLKKTRLYLNHTKYSEIPRWLNLISNLAQPNPESDILCTLYRVKKANLLFAGLNTNLNYSWSGFSFFTPYFFASLCAHVLYILHNGCEARFFSEHNMEGDYCPAQAGGQCRNPHATDSTDSHTCNSRLYTGLDPQPASQLTAPLLPSSPAPLWKPLLKPPFLHGVTWSFQWAS